MNINGRAPAKINLTLHITGQRDDGYHLLDSIVAFADFGDELQLVEGPQMLLDVSGPFATGVPLDQRNLVWQAAELAGWSGRISLEKHLPHAAGIGGGSSDAATVLRLVGGHVPPTAALALGADVPVCLQGQGARMRGIGEVVEPAMLPPLPALLVNPGVEVPTGGVFNRLTEKANAPMPEGLPAFQGVEDCAAWLMKQRNDLEHPAVQLASDVGLVLEELSRTRDVLMARMSGSGATCFALYPTMKSAHFAAYDIGAAHPDWWVRACTLS